MSKISCTGHGKGHKGSKKAGKAKKAKESCQVKLAREKKNVKEANRYLKKVFKKK